MNRHILRFLTIFLPVLFFFGLIILRSSLASSPVAWGVETLVFIVALLGIILFSSWVFRFVEQNEREIKTRSEQLAALHQAALSLTEELDLNLVLQKVVDLARGLANARYGALGVLAEKDHRIEQFISSGLSAQQRSGLPMAPNGYGLLGAVIKSGEPIRVSKIEEDRRSTGFPTAHPVMQSFLGVPIKFKDEVIGELYLTDKIDDYEEVVDFSEQDQHTLEMFATQAAIAIKNAQLYRKSQQLSILQERERFGMDLHDGIIQSIYAIGLMLDDSQHRIQEDTESTRKGINQAIRGLNEVIKDIRNYILDLRPNRFQGRDLKEGLNELTRELRANSFLDVNLVLNDLDVSSLTPEKTVEILHIVQESLSNVRKHAHASCVDIVLNKHNHSLYLSVSDNGLGLTPESVDNSTGNGLKNMRERAQTLGGNLELVSPSEGGTQVILTIPNKFGSVIHE
jgi:signal transduction histidine kinase